MIASIGFGIASPLFAAVFGDMLEVILKIDQWDACILTIDQ